MSNRIWSTLTQAVRGAQSPCLAAVAYFGAGAGRLLPLPAGSRLVVDASERAVASGQTCPAELAKLVKRGVQVYSVPNLHAKVFVLGGSAFIGSTNVSNRSAYHLVEAVLRTTEPAAVRAASKFVRDLCLHEISPGLLKQLAKIYRPPVIPGGTRRRRKQGRELSDALPQLPRIQLAKLIIEEYSDDDQALHDTALPVAEERRHHQRGYELDSFMWKGQCSYRRGDVIIQVIREGPGRTLVAPPGTVLHVRTHRKGLRQTSFVYMERPSRRHRALKLMARAMGRGAPQKMERNGLVRDPKFAQALLNYWAK